MKRKSIFATFFSLFLVLILLSIGASAIYSINTFNNFIYKIEKDGLVEKTEILSSLFDPEIISDLKAVREFGNSGKNQLTRITIIRLDGKVLADSLKDPEFMNNHLDRPEIKLSQSVNRKVIERFSDTLNMKMLYYALPVYKDGVVVGFIRTAISVEAFNHRVNVVYITIVIISIVIILLSVAICYILALKFSETINSIKKVANYYSKGDFNYSLTEDGTKEIVSLSKSINNMGRELQNTIFTINKQKNRYKSMLESMTEQVIRLDSNLIIEEMNSSAETMFNKKGIDYRGISLLELIKNTELFDFSKTALMGEGIHESLINFDDENVLQVHGSVLFDQEKNTLGLLLVMSDMTDLVRLEALRKEFVANVSHELRTPVTTIQGYIETLMSNSVEPDKLNKFLDIVHNNTVRINNIISDLLTLAGLDRGKQSFTLEYVPLADLIYSAVNATLPRAEKRGLTLAVKDLENCNIYAHPLLAEQALTNLIVNGIKYSQAPNEVVIKTLNDGNFIIIEVQDSGCGISQGDMRHIFDRFYRVDKARTRDQGGSGLGLSIVKRIMGIHGGEATVESELGEGSIFRLHFPIK